MADVYDKMANRWKSEIVARTHVEEFSGGLLKAKTMANLDCLGLGPATIRFGKKIAYEVTSLVAWMRERSI